MKTWYCAKCENCYEIKRFFCTNPSVTAHYLSDKDEEIQNWFTRHYGCNITLHWRDDHLDALWNEGYTNKDIT